MLPTSYFLILTLVIVNICGKDVINIFLFSILSGRWFGDHPQEDKPNFGK